MSSASTPARLGIYYGWPSAFNGASSLAAAVDQIAAYGVMVFGGGLHDRAHGDHANTTSIISALAGRVIVCGYIPLGSATGLSARQIRKVAKAWRKMGVVGVLLDEAGYDYGNTRERQNEAYDAVHDEQLSVLANGWNPADLLDTFPTAGNKKGAPPRFVAGDALLYESYRIRDGAVEAPDVWRKKADALAASGLSIMGVSTAPRYDQAQMDLVVSSALRDGLYAVGWGEHLFAAPDNVMPLRPWPALPAAREGR